MFGSAVLEALLALSFLYLLLSVVCSAVNELIARSLKLRHQTLVRGLGHLLQNEEIRQQLMRHPLIRVLGEEPTHIPSHTFALALLDLIAPAGKEVPGAAAPGAATPGAVAPALQGTAAKTPATGHGASTGETAMAAAKVAGQTEALAQAHLAPPLGFEQLREAVGNLPDGDLRRSLLALVDASQRDLDAVRDSVADWFDATMQRASSWYKERAHWILLGLAAVVSIGLNADSLELAENLWRDSGLRQGLVEAADSYVATYGNQGITPQEGAVSNPEAALGSLRTQLSSFELPFGWSSPPTGFADWVTKILGLLLTTLAVSLGAPFWFDVVNKVILVRGDADAKS